ncbi:hypothetical protein AV656_12155 [Bhargavaea cecembensis]|uniref:Uncharacterized protein n=1 Tax=Bhargavaea cecembensis TaxID=394098 RepID=A0A165GQW1_9BACL|nr:hypothetical protein [Bhargavaea cecembensis]KZE37315.1 hypothetical protein AV656_12155 [Bhargavaea cecembensis]
MDPSSKKPSFSSPASAVSAEETRILEEQISQMNLFKLINQYEPHRKTLVLKKFFKMKRHQEVVITPKFAKEEAGTISGKVTAIGRDFVMLTNLKQRIWIPYTAIESAEIPFGTPTYSNPHQNFIYDNQLRQKIILKFGETVSKRDALVQQFFEESLRTNLHTWQKTWVEVLVAGRRFTGRIERTDKKNLYLKLLRKNHVIPLEEIQSVSTIRLMTVWKEWIRAVF